MSPTIAARLLGLFLALAAAALCGGAAAVEARGADFLERLIADLDALRVEHELAAYGLVLVTGEEVLWSEARGVADRETGRPLTPDTMFRIGSVTKAFTSLALLVAEQEGKLALTDPVRDILDPPPYQNPWAATDPVRIVHLLEHTAGLTDLSWEEMRHSDPRPITLAEALAFRPENRRVRWRPGVHASYSNAGAGIAARVLEERVGMSYERYLREKLFEPLGMDDSTVLLTDEVRARLATGYDRDGRTVLPYWHMLFRPFGAINVTLDDIAAFVQLQLNDGVYADRRLLPAAKMRRMEVPATTLSAKHGLDYGYGLGNYAWYRNGHLFHGHGGDADGYLSHYGYNRGTGLGYYLVITRFRGNSLRALRNRVEDFITAGRPAPRGPRARLPRARLEALAGRYEAATWRFAPRAGAATPREPETLDVVFEDGRLYTVTAGGRRRELVPVTASFFRRRNQPAPTIAMLRGPEGRLILQGDIGNYRKAGRKAEAP